MSTYFPKGEIVRSWYVVDADGRVAEALAAALIASGFGLLAMEPAPVDLEALFLRLTGDRAEAAE